MADWVSFLSYDEWACSICTLKGGIRPNLEAGCDIWRCFIIPTQHFATFALSAFNIAQQVHTIAHCTAEMAHKQLESRQEGILAKLLDIERRSGAFVKLCL